MGTVDWLLTALSVVAGLAWAVLFLSAARSVFVLERLSEQRPPAPEPWPKLSVVVAACNEERTLEAALATLCAADYPNLELIVIDDRSTDRTAEIVDAAAARDPRVVAIHIRELPDGWLGKVHALDRGAKHATGEWLLFTDADVHFAHGALRRAVAVAIEQRLDHLILIPQLLAGSFWHEVTLDAFGVIFLATVRPHAVEDPNSDAYVGSGAFNLVRAKKLAESEGFQWLRMDVADDLALGLVLRRAGARAKLLVGASEVAVEWYPSLRAMFRGLEKNLFAVTGHYSAARVLLRLLPIPLILLGPFVGVFREPMFLAPAVLALGCLPVLAWALGRIGQRFTPALLVPFGLPVLGAMALTSTLKCLRAGGIEWRGTHYPLAELRALQRVKL